MLGALLFVAVSKTASAQEVIHDFRGSKSIGKNFRPEGPNSHQYITPEPEGLRWRFVPDEAPTKPVGIYWRNWVHGDFAATVRYEVLEAEPANKSSSVGPQMYLMLDGNPHRDGVAFTLQMQSLTVSSFQFLLLSNNQAGQRITKNRHVHPAPAGSERGRMRLAREGAMLVLSIAPGDEEQFQEIHRAEIGEAPIRMVRFAGVNGGDATAKLDMRLLEFRIEGKNIGPVEDVAAAPLAQKEEAEAPVRPRFWRLWAAGIVGVVCLAGMLIVVRRKMRPARPTKNPERNHSSSSAAAGEQRDRLSEAIQPRPDTSAGMIGFACHECGKNLKVKLDCAGRRVKCPECGHSVTAPSVVSANGK
jgi:DNA-directed RNA polymerase subunit RPC12/RpoP